MDPGLLGPEQWGQINRLLIHLVLFVGLAVNGAIAFLLAHAIIPSLVGSAEAPRQALAFRWVLYPLFAASLALTFSAFARALRSAIAVLQQIYPRFAI
jgi:uncharacterized membrane protein